ncbi:MAG: hypothetical protein U0414_09485 [Polyangiaceae bacterium]
MTPHPPAKVTTPKPKKAAPKKAAPKKAAPKKAAPKKAAPKKAAPKKAAPKKAAPRKAAPTLARLHAFLEQATAQKVGKPLAASDAALASILGLVRTRDPDLARFMELLIERRTSYCVFDLELYPEMFLRGKRGEPWNAAGAVIGDRDVCLGRNGAGDVHVWDATTGAVRLLVHDEGWRESRKARDVESAAA